MVVVTVEPKDVTSVVRGSVSAMAEDDDNEAGGVFGDPKFRVEEEEAGTEAEAGGVSGEPKFKVEEEEVRTEEAGLVAGTPKSEEEEEEGETAEVEDIMKLVTLVLVLVLAGQGPNGVCESIDVPWGAITMVTVCEMMELQGNGAGSPPSADDDDDATTEDSSGAEELSGSAVDAGEVVNELVGLDAAPTDDGKEPVDGKGESESGSAEDGGTNTDEEADGGGAAADGNDAGRTVVVLILNTVVVALIVTVAASGRLLDAKTEIDGGNKSVEKASALPADSETQITSVASKGSGSGRPLENVKVEILATVCRMRDDADGEDDNGNGTLLLFAAMVVVAVVAAAVVIVGTDRMLSEIELETGLELLVTGKTVEKGTQTEPD